MASPYLLAEEPSGTKRRVPRRPQPGHARSFRSRDQIVTRSGLRLSLAFLVRVNCTGMASVADPQFLNRVLDPGSGIVSTGGGRRVRFGLEVTTSRAGAAGNCAIARCRAGPRSGGNWG